MACNVATATNSPSPIFGADDLSRDKNAEALDLNTLSEFTNAFGREHAANTTNEAEGKASSLNNNQDWLDTTFMPDPLDPGASPYTDNSDNMRYFDTPPVFAFNPGISPYQSRQRSISEPPADFTMDRYHEQQAPVQMTFHRNGHYLGDPAKYPRNRSQKKVLKSLPKHKRDQLRAVADARNNRSDQQPIQQRYHLRRTQTQPARPPMAAPTSAPTHILPPQQQEDQYMVPHQMQNGPNFENLPPAADGQRYISSRICTPAPEPFPGPTSQITMSSHYQQHQSMAIDPRLTESTGPVSNAVAGVTVPLTAEQIKQIITDAVGEAIGKQFGSRGEGVVESVEGACREAEFSMNDSVSTDINRREQVEPLRGAAITEEAAIKEEDSLIPAGEKHPDDMTLDELLDP
ncbi:hypothetical protein KC332_g5506 [Hortaea werneckii]|uniref:Uncharacterized protein n=1 Tax=Hortaea werneckii TaxID=91943 RepID=A0A3M7IH33_HORWE|nr:hypothetical protein KC358_g7513 [Hortaea werneckii]KAI6845673.1 hypothetical protein KC350_g4292 [Hortaea werneckii]KAI6941146.1 hypothetical protein KC341_g3096 [Hortaea werneckii]KAI6945842.1 hypothetical protein KC348_g3526 [Hortaea werneckii]KAI6963895.1 hypothetical protein KC321_g10974 [Hortaea werneckii]